MRERQTQTTHQSVYAGSSLSRPMRGKVLPYMPAFQPYGENPPYGMIGRVEETSASFEARSAPRLYPTERLGVKFPVLGITGGYRTANMDGRFFSISRHKPKASFTCVVGGRASWLFRYATTTLAPRKGAAATSISWLGSHCTSARDRLA